MLEGKTFPARAGIAREIAGRTGRKVDTVLARLRYCHDDAEAVLRHFQARPPGSAARLVPEAKPKSPAKPAAASQNRSRHDLPAVSRRRPGALAFLREELAEDPLPASEVEEEARGRGISNAALARAKAALKVTASRLPNGQHGASVVHLSLPG